MVEVARVFALLGLTGFGGPAAHIALMQRELAERRGWIEPRRFIDLLGVVNLLPGPNSTELAMELGRLRAGAAGLVVAGTAFILPAAVLMLVLAWAYTEIGALPEAVAVLHGVRAVAVGLLAALLASLLATLRAHPFRIAVCAAAAAAGLLGVHELLVLLGGGLALAAFRRGFEGAAWGLVPLPLLVGAAGAGAGGAALLPLLLVFLKIGATLYGSGYVLFAFLHSDLVDRLGWLTEAQLLDAVAAGQLTPGPLFTTATFVGYLVAGIPGALLATVGIFLPAFVLVAVVGPHVARLRRHRLTAAVLDGVGAAAVGLIVAVVVRMAAESLTGPVEIGLAAGALLAGAVGAPPALVIVLGLVAAAGAAAVSPISIGS